MNKSVYYILGFILCFVRPALADTPEAAAGSSAWVMTLETIKAKAKELMARNTQLSAEYNTLARDINNLNAAIDAQNKKNAATASFLKDRHGRTDQQVRIEELEARIKEQKARLNDRRSVRAPHMSIDDELDGLRKQLEAEKAEEARLEAELQSTK